MPDGAPQTGQRVWRKRSKTGRATGFTSNGIMAFGDDPGVWFSEPVALALVDVAEAAEILCGHEPMSERFHDWTLELARRCNALAEAQTGAA